MTPTERVLLGRLARYAGWASAPDIAEMVRCHYNTAKASLQRLESSGLVRRTGRSKATLWAVTERGAEAVNEPTCSAPDVPTPAPLDNAGRKLADWMRREGVGTLAAARALGVAQSTVSRWTTRPCRIRAAGRAAIDALLSGEPSEEAAA